MSSCGIILGKGENITFDSLLVITSCIKLSFLPVITRLEVYTRYEVT